MIISVLSSQISGLSRVGGIVYFSLSLSLSSEQEIRETSRREIERQKLVLSVCFVSFHFISSKDLLFFHIFYLEHYMFPRCVSSFFISFILGVLE